MAIVIGDVYKAHVKFRLSGQLCYNVFSMQARAGAASHLTIGPLLNHLGTMMDAFAATIIGWATNQLEYLEWGAVFEHGAGGPHGVTQLRSGGVGTSNLDALPQFTSAVVRANTGLTGRSRRGRTHLLGLHEGQQVAGVLGPNGLADLAVTVNFMNSQPWLTGNYWRPVVYSRTRRLAGEPDFIFDIENYTLQPVLGTMYSRKLGVGS